jgi:hypothetical protein
MTESLATRAARPSLVQQFYGYGVCLIAIVTMLVSASTFVEALFDRAEPLQAAGRFGFEGSLTSFESYRATQQQREGAPLRPLPDGAQPARGDTLSTAEQRARYEALRADHIARVAFESMRRLVRSGLLMLIAAALFVAHWRWLRALATRADGAAARAA